MILTGWNGLLLKGLCEEDVEGFPANATCWNEVVDIGGDGGFLLWLRFGSGGARLLSDEEVYEDEEAEEPILFGLELLPLRVNGEELEEDTSELLSTLSTLSFSSCSSACFQVFPFFEAIRLCFIKAEVTWDVCECSNVGFEGSGGGGGGLPTDTTNEPCLGGG